ncbi:Oidioi.mRNA.OKI2018_I69.PAR.g11578.t1.cds [Oikopleura dioica]|uniref:Oidioi.mRNA.OKI2018_I69.PAR.g11578.t1.cds n=1 Tax=Oikopleura dioica TaxID=34765 RepID=A0ABN7RWS5_OIKDI|nr:Oidioi.mRNA.OKI2018_I69.PAR.g11578.t1.cds [Oikopleura dioica]
MVLHWTEIEVEKLQDYGCASRGYFDSTDPAVGLPVDEIDRSFIWWKKCIKCARSEYSAYDLEYNHFDYTEMYEYDSDTETCGGSSSIEHSICQCDQSFAKRLVDLTANDDFRNYDTDFCVPFTPSDIPTDCCFDEQNGAYEIFNTEKKCCENAVVKDLGTCEA